MNMIILIGNGFDLAHGLKTGYTEFVRHYWTEFAGKIVANTILKSYDDKLVELDLGKRNRYERMEEFNMGYPPTEELNSSGSIGELLKRYRFKLSFHNKFREHISGKVHIQNWVGIENEYYLELKKCLEADEYNCGDLVKQLNNEFCQIKELLEKYLMEICEKELSQIEIINIHGELNNPDNPIIFGYGDELDEDYREIERTNDNDFLDNIKSIAYGNTDNYRRLLEFLQLDQYQVYILGHSCGNSDRTLLNEIFEHPNCASIKPFYHKKEDGSDDFSDVYKNISRNFNNKRALRDVVVNKIFCEPLPQI